MENLFYNNFKNVIKSRIKNKSPIHDLSKHVCKDDEAYAILICRYK